MRTLRLALPFLLAACGGGAKQTAETVQTTVTEERPPAGGALEPRSGSQTTGFVTVRPKDGGVEIEVKVANASPGKHGVHLHETGDCSAPDATSAGAHWNPDGASHAGPGVGHGGDMGNIEVGEDGTGTLVLELERSVDSVKGKALVVHATEDDLRTDPSGNSGARIACGVIVEGP